MLKAGLSSTCQLSLPMIPPSEIPVHYQSEGMSAPDLTEGGMAGNPEAERVLELATASDRRVR